MARGRLISKSLSTSAKFAQLQVIAPKLAEFCQSLYMLLVAHADDYGRQAGDVFTIKHVVCPASPRSMRDVEAALAALHQTGMIVWYEDEGRKCVQVNDFDTHQPGLSRRTKSKFTEPTDISMKFTGAPGNSLLTEQKLTEQNGTEVNRTAPRRGELVNLDGFDAFYAAYPKRKNPQEAKKAWAKLAPDASVQQQILAALSWQRRLPDWVKDGGQFVPFPATYLNNRRWEDEPVRGGMSGQLSDVGMQSLVGLSAFRARMAAKVAGGEQ